VDANVDEPNTDISTAVGKFFGNLQNYQRKEPLQDLGVLDMTKKQFWQHYNKDYTEFEYGKLFVQKQVHVKLSWIMRKFHEWYYLACVYGLSFIEAKISGDIFKTSDIDLHVKIFKLHTIYHLKMLDITMLTVWCM
jgi:hypothetical protein